MVYSLINCRPNCESAEWHRNHLISNNHNGKFSLEQGE